jgi:hypothetical protein
LASDDDTLEVTETIPKLLEDPRVAEIGDQFKEMLRQDRADAVIPTEREELPEIPKLVADDDTVQLQSILFEAVDKRPMGEITHKPSKFERKAATQARKRSRRDTALSPSTLLPAAEAARRATSLIVAKVAFARKAEIRTAREPPNSLNPLAPVLYRAQREIGRMIRDLELLFADIDHVLYGVPEK